MSEFADLVGYIAWERDEYSIALSNTEVPGVEPQGELWEPGAAVADEPPGPKDVDAGQ